MSKNKHFSEDERLNLVIGDYESGKSKNAFCKLSGISPQVLANWLKRFEEHSDIISFHERLNLLVVLHNIETEV
ncbi:MAG: hypothetical protein ACRC77_02795 [Bacteroidales bacterium]